MNIIMCGFRIGDGFVHKIHDGDVKKVSGQRVTNASKEVGLEALVMFHSGLITPAVSLQRIPDCFRVDH